MPGVNEFPVQTILNRVFIAATNKLATTSNGLSGDVAPKVLRTPQLIWNNVFNPTLNELRL